MSRCIICRRPTDDAPAIYRGYFCSGACYDKDKETSDGGEQSQEEA